MKKLYFFIYNLILYISLPFFVVIMLVLYLIKNKHASGFFCKLAPYLSFTKNHKNNIEKNKYIWIHAVSVGEVNAAFYFINLLLHRINNKKIYLSVVTRTGYAHAVKKFSGMPVSVIYFPYDFLFSVKSIIKLLNPICFISMETEIWPNLFNKLNETNTPIFILNARLSERSFKSYYKFRFFFAYIFKCVDLVACISQDYYNKFIKLGVDEYKLHITGNMKFDIAQKEEIEKLKKEGIKYKSAIIENIDEITGIQQNNCGIADGKQHDDNSYDNGGINLINTDTAKANKNKSGSERYATKIIIAGSTHEKEEQIVLDLFLRLTEAIESKDNRKIKFYLMIAPRHPERFRYVYELIKKYKFNHIKISDLIINGGKNIDNAAGSRNEPDEPVKENKEYVADINCSEEYSSSYKINNSRESNFAKEAIANSKKVKSCAGSYSNSSVILIDKMGILNALYSIADIAFVGGSMIPAVGGHNMLEPLSFGVPVVFGNFVENFQQIADELISSGAGIMAANPEELFTAVYSFINNEKKSFEASAKALEIIERNQGSSLNNLNLLMNFCNII
jgi:3-deoxy-D-manno-octulosonic-acid transferase